MGALRIDCYCNETQMNRLVKFISKSIDTSDSDIQEIDEVIEGVRLTAKIESYLGKVSITDVAVMDDDWDILEADTVVLKQRLEPIANNASYEYENAIKRATEIKEMEREYAL